MGVSATLHVLLLALAVVTLPPHEVGKGMADEGPILLVSLAPWPGGSEAVERTSRREAITGRQILGSEPGDRPARDLKQPDPLSTPADATEAAATASLIDQLERCWRPRRRLPTIRVKVMVSNRGWLAGPPIVMRDRAAKAGPDLTRAENEAIVAIIGCSPYVAAANGRRSVEVTFGG